MIERESKNGRFPSRNGRRMLRALPFAALRHEESPDTVRIELNGELDLATAPAVEAELLHAERHANTVIVDLRGLRFMDSSGLRVIAAADQRIREGGGRLAIVRGPSAVHRVFELVGMESRFEMVDGSPAGER